MTYRIPPGLPYALQSLLGYLDKEYYCSIEQHCRKITYCITEIHDGDTEQSASLYTALSKSLAEKVMDYIQVRRVTLMPYLAELEQKSGSGHDCHTCSVSCIERHSARIRDLQDNHNQIRDLLQLLGTIVIPAARTEKDPDWERILHREIAALEEQLSELIYLEQTALMPQIEAAQKKINAVY